MGGFQVIARAPGTATITVKTEDGGKTASCTVTVKEKIIPVESITLDQSEKTLNIGETVTLKATVSPENATNKNISWSSDKTDVATVDESGNVSANSVGTATIKATADGVTAECTIIVEEKVIPVESITLNKTEAEIFVGAEEKLTATVLPEDATNKDVTWTSSDTTIATVDSNGKVTAKSVGTAAIKAKAGDKSATCTIKVNPIKVTNVSITPPVSTTIKSGETLDLEAKVEPTNATNKTVTWSSDNPKVADVDQKGHVVALNQEGTAKITVTTEDGGKTDECIITVTVPEVVIPVEGVTLDKPTLDLKVGESIKLSATVKPDNATIKNVKWTSNNENVATVDGEGNVKAEGPGTTAITVETVDGKKKATCTVNVTKVLVTDVTITEKDLRLARGKSHQLEAIVQPPNATDSSVSWSTNDDTVATVDSNGTVTAKSSGTAVIWAYAGAYNDFCRVEVYLGVESVSIDTPPTELAVGGTATLTATINPSDAEDKTVTWSSDKPEIISVDPSTGEITAHQEGEATITVTTEDGEKTDSCKINVKYISLNGISLNNTEAFLKVNDTLPLTVTFNPENASNKNVKWISTNTSVATVDPTGLVTAIAKGNATIIVETEDGKRTDKCEVTVSVPVESVSVNPATAELIVGRTLTLEAKVLPKEANQGVVWSSTDDKVATVDENGIVTARAKGTATITATADGGKEASCNITVGTDNDGILKYSFNDSLKRATIVGYEEAGITNAGGNVTIPAEYMGYEVTRIEANTFKGCTALTELTIDGSVDIREYAFQNCTKLGSVNLGENVTAIRYNAFEGCSSLNEIVIPNSVTSIGSEAFNGCSNLIKVTIGSGIVYAANASSNAFLYCPITSFDCNSPAAKFDIRFTADVYEKMYTPAALVIEDFYTSIENYAFDGHKEKLISVVIKATEKDGTWKGVEKIEKIAFDGCSNLTTVVIPDSVTSDIYTGMFRGCNNLKYVTIGENVPYIEPNTFGGFPIVDFKCTSSAGDNVLINFKKEAYEALGKPAELVMENFYTSIDSSALQENTNLKKITISSNITEIPWNAFNNCTSLTSVSMDEANITEIGRYAFNNTKISEIEIPKTVTTIEQSAFSGTQISILDIPDSVTTLGAYAFSHCPNLTTVTIGSGIGSLENNPFLECGGITSYTIRRETPPTLGPEGLPGTNLKIYVPSSAVDTYKTAEGWSGYNIQAIE